MPKFKKPIHLFTVFRISLAVLICGGLLFSGLLFAETLYVKKSGTKLRAEASSKSKIIKKLNQGTSVQVVKKSKKFYQVSAPGDQKGWIFKFKLTAKKPEKSGEGGSLLDVLGGQKMAAKESASSSSIRGLSPMSEKHAKDKGISEADINAVKQMENSRVSSEEIDQFLAKRKLGEYGE